jgi:hypothetical protein
LPQLQWTLHRALLHSKPCCAALGEALQTLFGLCHCPPSSSFEPDPDIAIMLLLLFGLVVGFNRLFVGYFSTCWLPHSLYCFYFVGCSQLVYERYITKKKKKKNQFSFPSNKITGIGTMTHVIKILFIQILIDNTNAIKCI